MKPAKVLIVDDQRLIATSLQSILKDLGKELLGEIAIAADGDEALRLAAAFRPDLVLMDIFMPVMSGLEALKLIKEKLPDTKVLMLTTFGCDNYVKEAMGNGACGYLLKDTTPQEVMESIASALQGRIVLSQPALDALAGKPRAFNPKKSVVPEWFQFLTEKERIVLLLISQGLSNDEIADRLNLGKNTVRNYVSGIYEKIDAKDRFHAIRIAIEAQIHTLVME